MKFLKDTLIKDQNILMRINFDVPLNSNGEVIDDNRIKAAILSIKNIIGNGAQRLILLSHAGRPVIRSREKLEGIISGNPQLVMKPMAKKLANWLKINSDNLELVYLDGFELPAYKISDKLFLMENLRFLEGEQKCDKDLARRLSKLGNIFIYDDFATAHHASCSVSEISKILPSYAGLLVEKEIEQLTKLMLDPPKPFIMILGGAKIQDKILVLKNLIKKVDFFLLGGIMANTFLASRNIDLAQSIVEKDRIDVADDLMHDFSKKIILPVDLVWERGKVLDIGKITVEQYSRYIEKAEMIFINGTMGLTSSGSDKFALGTHKILELVAKNKKAIKIISGGDTVAEVNKLKLADKFTFVSTGGGATLEFLAGNKLPGLEALE
ncbi:MAG: hypothetical protein ACD_58C00273G0002 [uncultured bacterium]|nr:MAG: hypothetical protein ACD_58C00273G0002 [uncultured bacterium]